MVKESIKTTKLQILQAVLYLRKHISIAFCGCLAPERQVSFHFLNKLNTTEVYSSRINYDKKAANF